MRRLLHSFNPFSVIAKRKKSAYQPYQAGSVTLTLLCYYLNKEII